MKASTAAALQELSRQRDELAALQKAMDEAAASAERGRPVEPASLVRRAEALAREIETTEVRLTALVRRPLGQLAPGLRSRLSAVPGRVAESFDARQADHYVQVGRAYLAAAERTLGREKTVADLRRSASYLWRADQFATQAEQGRTSAKPGMATAQVAPPRLEPCERGEVLLNGEWEMTTEGTPDAPGKDGWFKIRVPHGPWGETIGRFMALDRKWPKSKWAWYRMTFPVPASWTQGRLKLHFEAVFHLCEVYVNGRYCGRHIGGFDAFDVDVTGVARAGQANQLLCFVHDTSITALEKGSRKDEPQGCSSGPNHYMISDLWGQRFGGIWQDVSLVVEPAVKVADVFVVTSFRRKTISVQTELRNETRQPVTVLLAQDVLAEGKVVLSLPAKQLRLDGGETRQVDASAEWRTARPWGIGGEPPSPEASAARRSSSGGGWGEPKNLYHLRSRLTLIGDPQALDTHYQRFGFREFWIENGQFWLNGKHLPLQGGGNWYLQEGKAPHGNRWFGLHMYRSERGMNVVIQRWHRHGDIAREFFDLGDELGMLSEPEGAYWGVYGVPDLMGFTDWDDPVWTANLTDHYRNWARKHRNHPSVALWSIENETFCQTTRPRAMVNLHYPNDAKLKDWRKKWGGRPCINGEFQNYPVLFAMSGPDPAKSAEAVGEMCKYIEHWTAYYKEIELSGALHFLPYMVGLFTTSDRALMGPWGDLLPDPSTIPAVKEGWSKGSVSMGVTVPIPWPSLSGPGIKCERLTTGSGNRSLVNWFDPTRPSITPNKAYEALARCWERMPPLGAERAPEVIVTLTDGSARKLRNAAVVARPLDKQATNPLGVMTDPNGTAWFVFQEPGRYEISCGEAKAVFEARRLSADSKPGYEMVPRLSLVQGR
jgi:hypothetical protein